MKKSSVRLLMLSCLTLAIVGGASPVMAQSTDVVPEKAVNDIQNGLESASAAAGYTGSTATGQPAGQAMTPQSLLPGTGLPATTTLGQPEEEKPVTMRYKKSEAETGFYGAELPKRLFNNVPSDWSNPLGAKQ